MIKAYPERETITASETKKPLLGAIFPQGSPSPLSKPRALLNFLSFTLQPGMLTLHHLTDEGTLVYLGFSLWESTWTQTSNRFPLLFFVSKQASHLLTHIFSLSLFAALCSTFSSFPKNLFKPQKKPCTCGCQWCEALGCCRPWPHQVHQGGMSCSNQQWHLSQVR